MTRRAGAAALAVGAAALLFAVWAPWTEDAAPPLSPAQAATYVAAAQHLARRYVDDAWCTSLVAGTLGTVPAWPHQLATSRAAVSLAAGPPAGRVPDRSGTFELDVSDARAVLPASGRSWVVRPRFCVAQYAYPRLVTTGGTTHPVYPPLPHRVRTLNQIFGRFPRYLGRVTAVSVPTTIEVAYSIAVDGGPPRSLHLWWITSLGFVPAPRLRLSTWDVGARRVLVTVRTDAPAGPVVVHSAPPGAGP